MRPFGVTLIAFVTLAMSLLPLLALARAPQPTTLPAGQEAELRRWAQAAGMWSALGLVTAAGLFGLRRWGWWMALAYYTGSILILLFRQPAPSRGELIFQVGLAGLILFYLASREVRGLFLHGRPIRG